MRNEALFQWVGFAGFLLIGVAVLLQGLRARPGGVEIGVMVGIAAVYLMLFARLGNVERGHLFEYGVLAILIYEALAERASQGRRVPVPALLAILAATLIGLLDECIQIILPHRVFDPADILIDFVSATLAVVGMLFLGWARGLTIRARRSL